MFDTRLKKLAGVIASLILAYIAGSLAIDSGSIALYFATMVFLLIAAKLAIRILRSFFK